MANKKRKRKINRRRQIVAKRAIPVSERPSVFEAVASKTDVQQEILRRMGEAGDRFAALMAKAYTTEVHDQGLMHEGMLTAEEHAELLALAPEKGREYGAEVERLRDHLAEIGHKANPLDLLANTVFANVIGIEGEYFEPTHWGSEAHVEYAAAVLSSIKRDGDLELPEASYEQVRDFVETINQLFFVARNANLARHIGLAEAGEETAEVSFLGQARYLSVRGDCYPQHGIALARDLYAPLKDTMQSRLGFDIEAAIALAEGAVDRMEQKLNAFLNEVPRQAQAISESAEPDPDFTAEQTMEAAIAFVIHEGITAALTFTSQELAEVTQQRAETVAAFLDRLSMPLLDGDGKIPTPFASHASSDRPIVFYRGRYLVGIPGRLARELAVLLDVPMSAVSKGFDRQKDRVVSSTATGLISGMLDNAPRYTHLFYEMQEGAEGRFELDGLVVFGRCLFIIEGKPGHLGAAERGTDLKRLKSRLEEHVVKALKQAQRARTFITSREEALFTDEKGDPLVAIRGSDFDHFFLVTPTLRLMADLGPQLRRLKSLELFEDEEYPFSIYINDLRVMSEFVRYPVEFIHYVRWRMELPLGDRIFVVDELDLFVSFLLREQFRRYLAATDGPIECVGSSSDLDDYYLGQLGRDRPKNKPKFYTPVRAVRDFLEFLAREQPDGWLDAAGTCLELSIPELAWLGNVLKNMPALGEKEYSPSRIEGPTEHELMPGTDLSLGVVAMGRSASVDVARKDRWVQEALEGIERVIYASVSRQGNPKILWAETRPLTESSVNPATGAGTPLP